MKNVLILSLLLITIMSCGGGGQPASGVARPAPTACTAPDFTKPGLYCTGNSVYAALEPGMCNSPSDCPNPYNFCDTNNRCQVQPAQAGSQQIWFATDIIRPGVTVNCNGSSCLSIYANDYIYNIMAKGYASLDDWCMSQAQQSTFSAMRNIGSWTAMIVAQPDQSTTATRAHTIVTNYVNAQNMNYTGPVSSNKFSNSNNVLYDKNGVLISQSGADYSAWSGIGRNYCSMLMAHPYIENGSGNYYCNVCSPSNCAAYQNYSNCPCSCAFKACSCYCENTPAIPPGVESVAVYLNNQGSNAWGNFNTSGDAGVFILPPANCSGNYGFDFSDNCGSGIFSYYANGTQQKSILCLANQS